MSNDESSAKQQHNSGEEQQDQQENQQQSSPPVPPGAPQSQEGGSGGFVKRQQQDRQLTMRERARLDEIDVLEGELAQLGDSMPNSKRLLELEIHRLRWGVTDMVDLMGNRRCKIRSKVLIPQDLYPGFNFVGKLLGQGGASLKKLQEDANVKMSILGAGSMRNDRREQECLQTGEAKYQHLKQTLHLQIDCLAEPSEAYYRISHALAKVKEAMTPDPNELAQYYSNHMQQQQQHPHQHAPHYGAYGPGPHQQHPHMQMPMQPPHHAPPYATGPPQHLPPPPNMGGRGGGRGNLRGGGNFNVPIGAMGAGGGNSGVYPMTSGMRGGRGGRGGMRGGGAHNSSNGNPSSALANGSGGGGFVPFDGQYGGANNKSGSSNGGYRGGTGGSRGQHQQQGVRSGYMQAA